VSWRARIEAALARAWWRPGLSAAGLLLWPLSLVYRVVTAARRAAYRMGWLASSRAPVPVIVVGNWVVGGAGKTPCVIALVHALRAAGLHPGVISRGHGRSSRDTTEVRAESTAAEVGDEPLLIRRRTTVPVWVGRRRSEAARALCAAHPGVDVLVADDGLQHLALRREVQLVVFDERGVGNGRLLPAGPLREPLPRHVPVNTHVLYNAAAPSTAWPGAIAQRRVAGAVRLADWWAGAPSSMAALHALRGRPVVAAAGLAAPQRFFAMLAAEGLTIRPLPLPDHHAFDTLPWPADTGDLLLTEKDAVKLPPQRTGSARVWVVPLDFRLPDELAADLLNNLRLVRRR
jgi:tetraacyldisaccharide 4'-kinase